MATVVRDMGCECYRVNGRRSRAFGVRLSRTITVADLVEKVKTGSSKWMKQQGEGLEQFTWQRGYAVFSAHYREIERLLGYIDGQEEHHRSRTFQEEYVVLLEENGLEFDERYVRD